VNAPERWIGVAVLFLAGACDSDLGPFVPRDWGLITLDHQAVGGGDYTRPQALFYSSLSSPTLSGRGASDVCGQFQYPSPPAEESIDEIPAGERVTLTIQGTEYPLVPTMIGSRQPYSMPEPGIAYRPGDSVLVDIPGAADGFPAMSIRGRTAEPFALGAIDTTAAASDVVTWTPAGDDSSRMVLSMQYHDDLIPGTGANTQVFCTFRDDGAETIPPVLLRGWTSSTGARRVQAVRWRSVLETETDAVLYLVSTYTVTKTSFP
jgi:hypothetical protein